MSGVPHKLDTTVLGAGCFWCIEAVFLSLNGVEVCGVWLFGWRFKKPFI